MQKKSQSDDTCSSSYFLLLISSLHLPSYSPTNLHTSTHLSEDTTYACRFSSSQLVLAPIHSPAQLSPSCSAIRAIFNSVLSMAVIAAAETTPELIP